MVSGSGKWAGKNKYGSSAAKKRTTKGFLKTKKGGPKYYEPKKSDPNAPF